MPNYRFKVHDGAGAERFGAAILADDDEAIAFAKRVMKGLMHRDADLYVTGRMEITAAGRSLANMPFEIGRLAATIGVSAAVAVGLPEGVGLAPGVPVDAVEVP